jgi:hypothetical protein
MTPEQLTEQLRKLNSLQAKPESLTMVRERVFRAIDRNIPAEVEITLWRKSMPTPFLYLGSGVMAIALMAVFVVGNLLPRHNAYHDTITAVVHGEAIASELERSTDPLPVLAKTRLAMARGEHAMLGLDLDGEFAAYTEAQCLDAHQLYHSFLSHLDVVVRIKQSETTDPALLAQYAELRMEIAARDKVLEHRLTLY